MINIPDTFQVLPSKDEFLILPGIAVGNYAWKDWKLRWLRSLHIAADNSIISSGFPKFMNLGEGYDKYNISVNEILENVNKDLFATLKIDGSLLIRYVRNGQVKWRTRGSLGVGLDNAYEIEYFCEQYPALSDPNLFSHESILFEWVTPKNKIVINYPEPTLYLVGGVQFDVGVPWWNANPKLFTISEMITAAAVFDTPMTDTYPLRKQSAVNQLIEDLKSNTKIEGFVLRFADCQRLVKLKTEHYKTLHALRSNLTTNRLVELWLQWEQPDWADYQSHFESAYDYECWEWALPAVSEMFDGIKKVKRLYGMICDFVALNNSLPRKEFAELAQQRFNGHGLHLCFSLLDGKEMRDDFWMKLVLQNCKQYELSMFKNSDDLSQG